MKIILLSAVSFLLACKGSKGKVDIAFLERVYAARNGAAERLLRSNGFQNGTIQWDSSGVTSCMIRKQGSGQSAVSEIIFFKRDPVEKLYYCIEGDYQFQRIFNDVDKPGCPYKLWGAQKWRNKDMWFYIPVNQQVFPLPCLIMYNQKTRR